MAAKGSASKKTFKTMPVGTPVEYPYRGAEGHGRVAGIASKGTTEANTRYKVRQVDKHVSKSGSKEKSIVVHTGAALHKTTPQVLASARKAAAARKKK